MEHTLCPHCCAPFYTEAEVARNGDEETGVCPTCGQTVCEKCAFYFHYRHGDKKCMNSTYRRTRLAWAEILNCMRDNLEQFCDASTGLAGVQSTTDGYGVTIF
jgi:hypothetical protein